MFRELPNLKELNEQRNAFNELKIYLSNATKWMHEENKKLVVIIDELDRCKPTFAIQTLEIVKHIFDIENIVFLFAVDIEQLSHSVSTIYGHEFDSVGYLCRFFDYIAKLPNPKIEKFISHKLADSGFDREKQDTTIFLSFISELVQRFNLSLRDVDTIMQSYKILFNTKLNEYEMIGSHMVCLFYLTLKYKKPDVYYKIFVKKSNITETVVQLQKEFYFDKGEVGRIKNSFGLLPKEDKLSDMSMDLYNLDRCDYKSIRIKNITDNKIQIHNDYCLLSINELSNWGRVLFYPDLVNWEQIKDYTYREYVHKQLENYNFINTELNEEV